MFRVAAVTAALVPVMLTGIHPAVAASDLRSAALTASDAPPGYSGPHTKVFAHYKKTLKLKVGKKGQASCKVMPQLKAGWKQGMLQDFTGASFLNVFEMCAFLQATTAQAHRAFIADMNGTKKQAAKTPGVTVTNPVVGNEAIEVGGSQSGFATYELIFRRDNTLIELVYLGGSSYTQSTFTSIGITVDTRLQSS